MVKRFLTYLTITCFSLHVLAFPLWAGVLSPSSFDHMYALAAKGNKEALFEARYRGLNIDSVNEDGDTGLCVAVKKRNVRAFNTFRAVGANVHHPCTLEISYYNKFLNQSSVRNENFFAKNYPHIRNNDNKKSLLLGAGVLGAGAALYFLLDHGGGGGGDDGPAPDPCENVKCPDNGHCVNGACVCDEGYVQINGQCLESSSLCNGHGSWNPESLTCECESGFNSATRCSDCVDDYVLYKNKCFPEKDVCFNGGTWSKVYEQCICPNQYFNDNCSNCISGYKLSGGTCVEDKEPTPPEPVDDCNPPHGTWQPNSQTCACDEGWNEKNSCHSCKDGYIYDRKDDECYLSSDLCGKHGYWNSKESKCYCDDGYVGTSCGDCADGYEKNQSGNCVLPSGNCNNHGTWNASEKKCECTVGWDPSKNCSECQAPEYVTYQNKCVPMKDLCDGHGEWNPTLEECKCNEGYQERDKVHCDPVAAAEAIALSAADDVRLDEVEAYGENVARMLALVRKISVTQEEEADAYGVKAGGKVSAGAGTTFLIDVENKSQTGDAYGIEAKSVDLARGGISAKGNADVYGIKAKEEISSGWNIHSQTNGTGEAYGIYADASASQEKQKLKNTGEIKVDGENAKILAGIYAKNYNVDNSGKITVKGGENTKAYGIYADNSNVVNSGEITVEGGDGSYGIYGQNHSSVLNTGKISLNGDICEGENCENGKQIGLDDTSVLKNSGQIQSTGALDFNKIGGRVLLGKGGSFEAESLSGKLGVASDVVSEGFKDEYVEENALKGENKDLEVESNSAMFRASSRAGTEEGSSDVVMNRQAFNTISQSQSIADYLEANYQQEKNEELFQKLKAAETQSAYEKAEAELTGTELIPNFSQENMRVLRNLNATMTEDLFNAEGKERKVIGYDYQYSERGDKGTLTGYENYANTMYFMYDKELENMLYAGLGMGITQFRSDYEDNSSRTEMMVQVFAPIGYNFGNGLKWQSIGRLGYSDGSYDRRTSNGTFEADLTSWIYGISNALRYSKDLGFATLEPEAQFNVLGYYQNRIREDTNKPLALRADAANNVSVESGFGLFIKRNMAINEYSKLKMKIGGMWYHEFANPYHSLTARHNGMVGKYRLRDRNGIYNRNRGVLRADVEYDWHSFTFYIVYRQYLEDEDPMSINAGVKYKF